MDWLTLWQSVPSLLAGTLTTIELLFCALALGLLLALSFTYLLDPKSLWPLHVLIHSFIYAVRGTPMLVQFFLIYFGLAQLPLLHQSFLWPLFKQPFFCAALALGINNAAYSTIVFRGIIKAIPHGETIACQSLGMSTWQRYRLVLLPKALRMVLPAYSNEVIMILKGTSLASAITLVELTGSAQAVIAQTYLTLPLLTLAGVFYLLLNSLLLGGFRLLEKKLTLPIS